MQPLATSPLRVHHRASRARLLPRAMTALGLSLLWSGCHFSDQELPEQRIGEACAPEGARQGDLLCLQGKWVEDVQVNADMGDAGNLRKDQGPIEPADMPRDTGGCVPETTEEICLTLGRCGVTLSISDRCNVVRNVECPRSVCPSEMLCNEAAGVCEAICTPDPCPSNIVCGMAPDGCGGMQVCDQCTAGTACDATKQMCECSEAAVLEVLCADRCGEVPNTLADTCFEGKATWQCPASCASGACDLTTNSCMALEELSRARVRRNERFGASLSLGGDYLMVGAPGEQTAYYGNVYIHHLGAGTEALDVRQSIDLGLNYEGYVLGTSVAMNRSGLALPGKAQNPRGNTTPNPSLNLLVNSGSLWQRSTTLDGTDASAGTMVVTSRNYFVVASPDANTDAGEVMLYTIDTSSQTIQYSRAFKGSLEGKLGSAMAMTNTQLLLGAPGAADGRGECRLARVEPDLVAWENPTTFAVQNESSLEGMCRAVALQTNLAAVGARRLLPSSTRGVDIIQLYTSGDNGVSWSLAQEIESPDARDDGSFGQAIALSPDKTFLFIGDPLLDAPATSPIQGAGAVHIYRQTNGPEPYKYLDTIRSNTPRVDGHFGQALAASAKALYIGAPDERVMSDEAAGVVYIYTLP